MDRTLAGSFHHKKSPVSDHLSGGGPQFAAKNASVQKDSAPEYKLIPVSTTKEVCFGNTVDAFPLWYTNTSH